MKPFQLLIKPVSFNCNLKCKYCFYLRVSNVYPSKHRLIMNDKVLEKLISQFLQFRFKESIFGWQGGEPTLAGLDFFKKVIKIQQKYGKQGQIIGNAIQTNGIAINDEWAIFLNKYHFLVGLSLDGPKYIHDKYRKSITGKSVYNKVMNAVDCLRKYNIEFNILCVISKANVNHVKQIYEFFRDNNFFHLQFIPALEIGQDGRRASFSISSSQYGKFLCQLFDIWKNDPNRPSIRLFNGIIAHYLGYSKEFCTLEKKCADYLVVEWNGDIFPCDFFVKNEYKIGNILNENLQNLKKKKRY
ncbi:MAG: anaerobic sulfatase maturase [Promethearchaeota archaeon]